jgi:hypothetical protein
MSLPFLLYYQQENSLMVLKLRHRLIPVRVGLELNVANNVISSEFS